MIASLLLLMESLFPGRLAAAARQVHVAALALSALLAGAPLAGFAWRRWRARRRTPRVSYWKCACGNANPPDAPACMKCAFARTLAWEERWDASAGARIFSRAGVLWRAAGWALYGALPLGVFLLLEGHRFGGGALREMFASLGLVAAWGAAVLGGKALGRRGGGPLARGVLLLSAGTFAGFTLLFSALWAAAPFPAASPLASVSLFADGRVLVKMPDGLVAEGRGNVREDVVAFRLRSALLSWPLLRVRMTLPVALGDRPLEKAWVSDLLEKGALRCASDAPQRLRIALREDLLFSPPGGPYVLRESSDGGGLVLEEPPPKKS